MSVTLRRLAAATVVLMYLVLVLGALVTNTGSGQGCGASWPLCNGRAFPLPNFHTMVEYSHRLVVTLATVLVLALAVVAWFRPGPGRRNRWFAGMAVFFLFAEAGIGGAAVIWPQPPALLATHFGISLLSYSGVFLLAMSVDLEGASDRTAAGAPAPAATAAPTARAELARFSRLTWFLLLYTLGLTYSGAYVRHTGSFCAGWPLCAGAAVPSPSSPEFPQFVHRLLAGLLLVGLFILWRQAVALVRSQPGQAAPELAAGAAWALAFGLLQALSGLVVVATGMSVLSAMVHSAILPLLFSAELYLAFRMSLLRGPGTAVSGGGSRPERQVPGRMGEARV